MDHVDYVTVDDALQAVELLGQSVRDAGLLRSAIVRPDTVAFGVEVYPSLHDKAAALMDALNRSHPLVDGNKRLSWVMTVLFYRRNGFDLVASADEGEPFVLKLAAGHTELPEVADWLAEHTVPRAAD